MSKQVQTLEIKSNKHTESCFRHNSNYTVMDLIRKYSVTSIFHTWLHFLENHNPLFPYSIVKATQNFAELSHNLWRTEDRSRYMMSSRFKRHEYLRTVFHGWITVSWCYMLLLVHQDLSLKILLRFPSGSTVITST